MIIGICGKSGSGKSTLANMIIDKYKDKAVHVDIDKIGHKVEEYDDVKKMIGDKFGKQVIINEKVDRKELGKIVFSSDEMMEVLTNITWPSMIIEIDKILDENKDKVVILDWLLLPKTKYFDICDFKVLLDMPYEVRMERALKRDGITKEKFELRDKASFNYEGYEFDYVIKDDGLENIKRMVMKI